MSNSTDKELDRWIDKYLPLAVPNYNMGLLPDEDGYSPALVDIRHHSEQIRAEAKSAIQAYVNNAVVAELERLHIETEYDSDYWEVIEKRIQELTKKGHKE